MIKLFLGGEAASTTLYIRTIMLKSFASSTDAISIMVKKYISIKLIGLKKLIRI